MAGLGWESPPWPPRCPQPCDAKRRADVGGGAVEAKGGGEAERARVGGGG
jgi:hypothetical protein